MNESAAPLPDVRPEDLTYALRNAWEAGRMRKRRVQEPGSAIYRPVNVYASRIRKCARAMALDMLHPEDDVMDQALTFERFGQGEEAEQNINANLMAIGPFSKPRFRIQEQQHKFEVLDRDRTKLITGKMDGRLLFETGHRPPYEVKSGKSYEGAETLEDLDSGVWSRAAVDQLLSYLYADDKQPEPRFGFIIVRRQSDFPAFIPVFLEEHLARVEDFLKRSRKAVDHRHARGPIPDFIKDAGECRRCPHLGKSCTPPMDFGEGWQVIDDPELVMAAETRERTERAHKEHESADKRLKDALRGIGAAILGNFQVTGKWQERTKYDVPKEVREQYARKDPQGAFTLTIERLPG